MGSVNSASRPLILVVDDDPDIAELLGDTLTLLGFRVRNAPHGAAALAMLEGMDDPPAAIVLDLMMPVMDGEQLGHILRGDPRFAAIPIIVLTARTNGDAIAADLHAVASLHKPVDLFQLRTAIKDAIRAQPPR